MHIRSANYQFGPYELRPESRELYKQGTRLKLRPQPFQVLAILVEHAGSVVTRRELRDLLWSTETFVDFEHGLNTAIKELRGVLNDSASKPRYIETLPKLGYRIIVPVDVSEPPTISNALVRTKPYADSAPLLALQNAESAPGTANRWKVIAALAALLALAAVGRWVFSHKAHPLTDRDIIVLADFTNTTGDPVFDETLKQALSVELTQSPFLNVSSDLKVSEMLRRMGRSSNDPLPREVAREACLRLGGKAILAGSIASLGSHYVVGLQVLGCDNGDILAASQVEAKNKESVLKAVSEVASQVRGKVGESLGSLEKYDFPVDTTTKSLTALRAFSLGLKALREGGEGEAIPFLRDAVQLDPEFALAHATLGRANEDQGEDNEAVTHFTKAFELRDRLSEREKYYITTLYNETVTGDMERAKEAGQMWVHSYPRDGVAREKLATLYNELGEVENADRQAQEALRLDPDSTINVFNAAVAAAATFNQPDETQRILAAAHARGLDGPAIHDATYLLAFLRGDRAEMERQVAWEASQGGTEYFLFSQHSDTEAYYGRMRKARDLSRRMVESATRNEAKEAAALGELTATLREVEVGNVSLAKRRVFSALALQPSRAVKVLAALVLARIGDTAHARALIEELESKNPSNTLIKSYWLPTLEASLELYAGNPQAAISLLRGTAPYELAETSGVSDQTNMYPTYLRGQAYLMTHNSSAKAEFKKIRDHRGIVLNSILGALSLLQLARAEVMMGDTDGARRHYGDFLLLWKDADPDIPILIAAKSEYAKLK